MKIAINAFLLIGLVPVLVIILVGVGELIGYETFKGPVISGLMTFYVIFCATGASVLVDDKR